MRLSKDLIQHIAAAISANLESKGLAKYDVPRDAVTAKITEIITTNMLATKVAPECKSPKNLIIFSKPKIGKTRLLSTLDNCLILDLEGGTKYLNAMKVKAKTFEDLKEIGKAIKEAGNPYKYIAVDTHNCIGRNDCPLCRGALF